MKSIPKYLGILLIGIVLFSLINFQKTSTEELATYHIVDLEKQELAFFWKNDSNKIYQSFHNLKLDLKEKDKTLVFAMNGGMYTKERNPQGLYIENGKILHKTNSVQKAYGNFYMQPNGIFYITNNDEAIVCKTQDFDTTDVKYATQSGPMLLIDGEMHPKFINGSKNLNIRNGVGILPDGNIILAISKKEINFYDFASFFKNKGCLNALYLDGFVSKIYYPSEEITEQDGNFGVIIGEVIKN